MSRAAALHFSFVSFLFPKLSLRIPHEAVYFLGWQSVKPCLSFARVIAFAIVIQLHVSQGIREPELFDEGREPFGG
jgi:hypothetical protein